jgi:hypothetical protein
MPIKQQIYIIILSSFLLAMGLIIIFVYPLYRGIQQDSKQIISQKNNVFLLQKEFNEAQNFQKKYEAYKSDLDKLDQMFVDSQNPVGFIEFIEKTASDFSTTIQISTPSFSKEGSLTFASLQVTCSGDFPKVLKFINALESGNYLAQIQNLAIASYKKDVSPEVSIAQAQATFSLKVFAK